MVVPEQKRVVNVYRLITRGTLEEKIMGLQKFKMSIANTVINQENTSMQSMGTDQLLNLFTLDKVGHRNSIWEQRFHPSIDLSLWLQDDKDNKGEPASSTSGKSSMKSVIDGLGELWDQQQYDTEYNLDSFMHSLH